MFHMIDSCDYCGTFQLITLEDIKDNGDVVAICHKCLKMFEDCPEDDVEEVEPDAKYIPPEKFQWHYVGIDCSG